MKLNAADIIRSKVATFIGVITWIHWANNEGTVDLGGELREVPCRFRYMGQHWIFNMDAYQDEDAGSNGAFAFCKGDKVVVLKKQKPADIEPPGWEYVAVAIMEDDESALVKRQAWPLFRIGHEAVVLGAQYANYNSAEFGFPFMVDKATRGYVNPFTDQQGNIRALGTINGTGNTKLVITKEVPAGGGDPVFVPHPAMEFMSMEDVFIYVPDILMQTEPNYKGRIVGISLNDEILIDNIPVLRITDPGSDIYGSRKSKQHTLIHINEASSTITLLRIIMDFEFSWYDIHPIYGTSGFFPPPYGFQVRVGTADLSSLCIYDLLNVEHDKLTELVMATDIAASWAWEDIIGQVYIRGEQYAYYCCGNTLDGTVQVGHFGKNIELFFYVVNEESPWTKVDKVAFRVISNEDGSYSTEKAKTTNAGKMATIPDGGSYSLAHIAMQGTPLYEIIIKRDGAGTLEDVIATNRSSRFIVKTTFSINREFLKRYPVSSPNPRLPNQPYTATTHRSGSNDDHMERVYRHEGGYGDFEIAKDECHIVGVSDYLKVESFSSTNTLTGTSITASDDTICTAKFIVFTHVDVANGIYGYWEVTMADNTDMRKVFGINSWPSGGGDRYYTFVQKNVTWKHYVATQHGRTLTYTSILNIPYGLEGWMSDEVKQTRKGYISFFDREYYDIDANTNNNDIGHCYNCVMFEQLNMSSLNDTPQPKYERFDGMDEWFWNTTNVHWYSQGAYWQNASAKYPDYYLHPFGQTPNYKKYERWPYNQNHGNPHLGIGASGKSPFLSAFHGSVLYSKNCNVIVGINLGMGEYRYSFTTLGGSPVVVKSPGYDAMAACTGRDDLVFSLT